MNAVPSGKTVSCSVDGPTPLRYRIFTVLRAPAAKITRPPVRKAIVDDDLFSILRQWIATGAGGVSFDSSTRVTSVWLSTWRFEKREVPLLRYRRRCSQLVQRVPLVDENTSGRPYDE